VRAPVVDSGIFSACQRLKVSDFIKALEKAGKSKFIDSFARTGISKGAHRAGDKLHDPVVGFYFAVKELGFKDAFKIWPRHIASDVVTPMSLPLPGTFLIKNDSWIVQMYSIGLLNFRTGVICPAIGVGITEAEVRWRYGSLDDKEDLDEILQQAHLQAAAVSAIAALLLVLFAPEIAAAAVVAFGASAVWSGAAAGAYWIKCHRGEIKEKTKAASQRASRLAKKTGTAVADRMRSLRVRGVASEAEEVNGAVALPQEASRIAVGLAAAAIVVALPLGPK
jgi:hypothetical protein